VIELGRLRDVIFWAVQLTCRSTRCRMAQGDKLTRIAKDDEFTASPDAQT